MNAPARSSQVAVGLLTLYFLVVAVATAPASYRPLHLGLLAGLYLLLGAALWSALELLAAWGDIAGALGAALIAGVLVWHLREQTYLPESLLGVAACTLLVAALIFGLHRWLGGAAARRPGGSLRSALLTGAFALLFVVSLALGFTRSETLRWHLLRHNTLLGTPAYYLLAPPVEELRAAAFAERAAVAGGAHRPPARIAAIVEQTLASRPPVRPDLVFVLIDTLRADALAAWGGAPEVMPRLNAFAARSYRFTDVLVSSTWTRPSVATFFTGLLAEEHGARDVEDPLAGEITTLAEVLAGLGYQTAAFVTNPGAVGSDAGFDQGFELFREYQEEPYARAEQLGREVAGWLADRPAGETRPLFLYLHYLDPHEPYLSGQAPRRRRAEDYLAAYRAELRYLDLHLGELLPALETISSGPTRVLVISDHGEEFFEHGLFGHGQSLYDEVARIPALLFTGSGSGSLDGRLDGRDVFELLLGLAAEPELSVPDWTQQHDREQRYLSLYFTGSGRLLLRPYRRHVFMRALEDRERKLIWSAYGETRELYARPDDPGETVNLLAGERERAEVLTRELDRQVDSWFVPGTAVDSERMREQLRALGYIE